MLIRRSVASSLLRCGRSWRVYTQCLRKVAITPGVRTGTLRVVYVALRHYPPRPLFVTLIEISQGTRVVFIFSGGFF